MISIAEKYRGVDVYRDSGTNMISRSDDAEFVQPLVRFHAFPKGTKVAAVSIEEVRRQIDDVLALPDPSAGSESAS